MRAVANGFAAASTDTGRDARAEPLATFAHDNLAKEIDYAFRAVHLTAVTAQAITATYTDQFDVMTPLVNWVEGGGAPDSIAAARVEQGQVTRTRPLCPYPQVARYSGSGSIDEARSFACAPPQ